MWVIEMGTLRQNLLRLARVNSEIRPYLIPLLQRTAARGMDRRFYLPAAVRNEPPTLTPEGTDLEFWLWEEDIRGKPVYHGIAFQGRAQKPLWFHYFTNEAQRDKKVQDTIRSRKLSLDAKQQRNQDRLEYQHGLKVGDILYSSWGYDQTNVDFYEVTAVRGKAVVIRQVQQKVVRSDLGSDWVVALPGRFLSGEPPLKKIPSKGWQGQPYIKLTSYSGASLWDGKPKAQTASGWGH